MSEMEPNDFDSFLKQSMSAVPAPSLSPGFNERLVAETNRRHERRDKFRRAMMVGYGLTSAGTCAAIMHGAGLDWGTTWLSILAPMLLLGLAKAAQTARLSMSNAS